MKCITESYTEQDYVLTAQLAKDKLKQYHELGRMKCISPRDIESDDGGYVFAEYRISDMKKDIEELKDYVNFINNLIEYSIYCGYVEMPEYPKSWGVLRLYPDDYPLDEAKIKYFKNPDGALKNKITRKKNSNIKSGKKTNVHVSPVNTKPKKEEVEDIEESTKHTPLYFYHLFPKDADLNKGIISPQYRLDHNIDIGDSLDKYRDRIVNQWGIYPDKNPDDLTDTEIIDALNQFRGKDGSNMIYFFRYPPYEELGPNMKNILRNKIICRIDINDPIVKSHIKNIFWGYEGSHSDGKQLNRKYYETVSKEDYFSKYDDNSPMIFASLNHIGISFKNGYIPKKCIDIISNNDLEDIEESVNIFSQYLYHGDVKKYDILKPVAPDLGNALQKPGWSLFCWKDKEKAKAWAIFKSIKEKDKEYSFDVKYDPINDKIFIRDNEVDNLNKSLIENNIYAYVYTIKVPLYKIGIGNDSSIDEYTYREEVVPTKVEKIKLTKSLVSKYLDIVSEEYYNTKAQQNISNYMNNRNFIQCLLLVNDFPYNYDTNRKLIDDLYWDLQVGDNIEKYIKSKGHTIKKVLPHQRIIMILNKKKELKSLEESSNDNIQDVAEDAKKLLYKEIVACKDGAHAYYDIMKPYVKDNAYAIIGWNIQNLQEQDRSTFPKYKSAVFNYCAKIFNDTHPQYLMNMDENCIYIQKINS